MNVTITEISGIGTKTAEILTKHGFKTVGAIAGSTVEKLSSVPGFGATRARTTIKAATALLTDPPSSTPKAVSSSKPKRAVSKKAARAKSSDKEKLRKEKLKKEKLKKKKLKKKKLKKKKLKKEKLKKEKLKKEKQRKEKLKKAKAKKKQKPKKR
jgi:hypothetical protein